MTLRNRPTLFALLLAGLLLLPAVPAAAGHGATTVLAYDGAPVQVLQDSYGELFPLGGEAGPRDPVLALEIPTAEGPRLELVPGTAGPDRETGLSVFYDRPSTTLFLFWESLDGPDAALNLISRGRDGDWSEIFEVSGEPFGAKSLPQVSITRDVYTVVGGDDGEIAETHRRSLLHLLWTSPGDDGTRVLYSPVLLTEDGAFLGGAEPLNLGKLPIPAVGDDTAPEATGLLLSAPRLAPGTDPSTVIITFADAIRNQLTSLEVDALHPELVNVADAARSHITVIGMRDRPDVSHLGDLARSHITVIGARLHPGVTGFLAARAQDAVVTAGDAMASVDYQALAEVAWREIVDAGAGFEKQGVTPLTPLAEPQVVRLGEAWTSDEVVAEPLDPDASVGSPVFRIQVAAVRTLPEIPEAPTRLFTSPDGRDVIVSWLQEDRLHFRESIDGTGEGGGDSDGWSPVQTLKLGDQLSLAGAFALLEERLR